MPTYDFTCPQCGNQFEESFKIDESKEAKCPVCEFTPAKRAYNMSGVRFVGPGFYVNDYGSKK